MGVYTSVPVESVRGGHAGTWVCTRYLRLEISAVPDSVHVFAWASAKLVAPAVCAVKVGLATTVPPMPLSSLSA
jgi:hypothetical protein